MTLLLVLAFFVSSSSSLEPLSARSSANCTYYGFVAYPSVEVSLVDHLGWATGKTPLVRFRSDEKTDIKNLRKKMKQDQDFSASISQEERGGRTRGGTVS